MYVLETWVPYFRQPHLFPQASPRRLLEHRNILYMRGIGGHVSKLAACCRKVMTRTFYSQDGPEGFAYPVLVVFQLACALQLPLIMRFVWLVPLFSTEAKPHTYNRGCSSWRSSSYPAQVIGKSELRAEDSSACARFQFADPVAAGEVWLCVWIPEPSLGIVALESPCQDH